MTEITGRLEGWHKDPVFNIIWGHIFDDVRGRFVNGTLIHTSSLNSKPPFKEGSVVKTLNSKYLLGKPL